MKKYGAMLGFIIIVFLIQLNVFSSSSLVQISPNLLIIIIAGYGLSKGQKEGLIAGVMGGFLMDCIFSNAVGYYSLPYMYIGYAAGYFKKYLNDDNYLVPSLLCGTADFLMGLHIFVFSFAMRNRLNLLFYLQHIIIPEVVYTVIISLVLFRVQILINKKIDLWVKKRGKKVAKKLVE